jgi:hypothetical protein
MKVEIKVGSPSLEKFVAEGGRWTDWRHGHTTYDEVRGDKGGEEYNAIVVAFADEVLSTLTSEILIKLVSKWKKSHIK